MTETPPPDQEPLKAFARPPAKERKLSLDEQADMIYRVLVLSGARIDEMGAWKTPAQPRFMRLDQQDLMDLVAVWKTIRFMELHGADKLVVEKLKSRWRR